MSSVRTLGDVRADIDAIDDAIHDMLIRRTELVEEVRAIKQDWRVKIQPSREAEIACRLVARHHGAFPRRDLLAIWRVLICATLSFEGPFSVAVHMPDGDPGFWDVARGHFGPYTPMSRHGSTRSVLEQVTRQEATVGVLPMPRSDDADPWWRHLAIDRADAPRIIARLPFAGFGNSRSSHADALVICPVAVTATGRDRSFLVIDSPRRMAAVQLNKTLQDAGFETTLLAPWGERPSPQSWLYLVEVEGWLTADDPRLPVFREAFGQPIDRLVLIGGYAKPLPAAALDGTPAAAADRVPASEGAGAG